METMHRPGIKSEQKHRIIRKRCLFQKVEPDDKVVHKKWDAFDGFIVFSIFIRYINIDKIPKLISEHLTTNAYHKRICCKELCQKHSSHSQLRKSILENMYDEEFYESTKIEFQRYLAREPQFSSKLYFCMTSIKNRSHSSFYTSKCSFKCVIFMLKFYINGTL